MNPCDFKVAPAPIALVSPGQAPSGDPNVQAALDAFTEFGVEDFIVAPPESSWRESQLRSLIDIHGELRALYGMTGQFLCVVRVHVHLVWAGDNTDRTNQAARK